MNSDNFFFYTTLFGHSESWRETHEKKIPSFNGRTHIKFYPLRQFHDSYVQ